MNLNEKELYAKSFMFNVFIPSLDEIFKKYNEKEYAKWGYNSCRQSAVFGACTLEQVLPDYNWYVWEGSMEEVIEGRAVKYEHAWILGKNKLTGRRLLVDLARNTKERLFIPTKTNAYPTDHPEYKDMIITERKQLDWKGMIKNDKEYFTGMRGDEFLAVLKNRMTAFWVKALRAPL